MARGLRSDDTMHDADYLPDPPLVAVTDSANMPDNITIKNHFPVARIKRIMQADDDVGKVAQVTPVVVCELYPPVFPCSLSLSLPSSIY